MILTLTLNPSVDINYKLKDLQIDGTNRTENVSKSFGGKGLNVARVVKQLRMEVGATGFLGGHLGAFIRSGIDKSGIEDHFVQIEDETRNCIAVIHEGKQTEILEAGPVIQVDEHRKLSNTLKNIFSDIDIITISGSLPKGLDDGLYSEILKLASEYDVKVLLDTSGKLLKATLDGEYKPFFIKPNQEELSDLLGLGTVEETQILESLRTEYFSKIPLVVITMGDEGAYVKYKKAIYKVDVPKINVVNPVGSGDSVVAGFAAGLKQNMEDHELIKFGLSMGVLNAMEAETGSINFNNIQWCINQISFIKQWTI